MEHEQQPVETLVAQAFQNQSELNDKLRPDWAAQGWRYYRAVWTELAEAIGHTNWYWWKHGSYGQPMSDGQLVELYIEIADILHFGLSMDLVTANGDGQEILNRCREYRLAFEDAPRIKIDMSEEIEAIVVDAILIREFNIKKFARVCHSAGLSLPKLMAFYFAKTVLNRFRWDNGYNDKPRTYVKDWPRAEGGMVEDNTIMGEMLSAMLANVEEHNLVALVQSGEFQTMLYETLHRTYYSFIVAKG